MSNRPIEPYDLPAYEAFLSGLKVRGFNPVAGTRGAQWKGPLPASLQQFADSRMMLEFRDGWPFRSPRVLVEGLNLPHVSSDGEICLWADDDPAQQDASDLDLLFSRIDEWAEAASGGFGPLDAALDAHLYFNERDHRFVEVDLPGLIRTDRHEAKGDAFAHLNGEIFSITKSDDGKSLRGRWYFRSEIADPPRDLASFKDALTHAQRTNFDRTLRKRREVGLAEVSGAIDFAILVWKQPDALNAQILLLRGTGDATEAVALTATPSDDASLLRRSGRDRPALHGNRVLIVGAGAVGGHVAVALAEAGVGSLVLADSDVLTRVNVTRHVAGAGCVGWPKTRAVEAVIRSHMVGTDVATRQSLLIGRTDLAASVDAFDLVIDCTGIAAVSSSLAIVCRDQGVALVSAALYRGGRIVRVRRQAGDDTPLTQRYADARYHRLPRGPSADAREFASLELGCSAPVHNASAIAVLRAASLAALTAVDQMTNRRSLPDEIIEVLEPLEAEGFGEAGNMLRPRQPDTAGDA